jgi:phosphoribosylglycinamide formyltransferase 2
MIPAFSGSYSLVKIGTPLSSTAKRVMLLGSGELGNEVIVALQRLGVEVIAVQRIRENKGSRLDIAYSVSERS